MAKTTLLFTLCSCFGPRALAIELDRRKVLGGLLSSTVARMQVALNPLKPLTKAPVRLASNPSMELYRARKRTWLVTNLSLPNDKFGSVATAEVNLSLVDHIFGPTVSSQLRMKLNNIEDELASELNLSLGEVFLRADAFLKSNFSELAQSLMSGDENFYYSGAFNQAYLAKVSQFAPVFAQRMQITHSAANLRSKKASEEIASGIRRHLKILRATPFRSPELSHYFYQDLSAGTLHFADLESLQAEYRQRIAEIDVILNRLASRDSDSDFLQVFKEVLEKTRVDLRHELGISPQHFVAAERNTKVTSGHPAFQKTFNPPVLPGIDPQLVTYRTKEGQDHRALYQLALNLSAKDITDSLSAERLALSWLSDHAERWAWIEAEVASELGLEQADVFAPIDHILDPSRLVQAMIDPRDGYWPGSAKFYSQDLIDLYLAKLEKFNSEIANRIRDRMTLNRRDIQEEVARQLNFSSTDSRGVSYRYKDLALKYQTIMRKSGKTHNVLMTLLEPRSSKPFSVDDYRHAYSDTIERVEKAATQVSTFPNPR